jgi:hypothetical protein
LQTGIAAFSGDVLVIQDADKTIRTIGNKCMISLQYARWLLWCSGASTDGRIGRSNFTIISAIA